VVKQDKGRKRVMNKTIGMSENRFPFFNFRFFMKKKINNPIKRRNNNPNVKPTPSPTFFLKKNKN